MLSIIIKTIKKITIHVHICTIHMYALLLLLFLLLNMFKCQCYTSCRSHKLLSLFSYASRNLVKYFPKSTWPFMRAKSFALWPFASSNRHCLSKPTTSWSQVHISWEPVYAALWRALCPWFWMANASTLHFSYKCLHTMYWPPMQAKNKELHP